MTESSTDFVDRADAALEIADRDPPASPTSEPSPYERRPSYQYARDFDPWAEKHKLALVPHPSHSKGPTHSNWQHQRPGREAFEETRDRNGYGENHGIGVLIRIDEHGCLIDFDMDRPEIWEALKALYPGTPWATFGTQGLHPSRLLIRVLQPKSPGSVDVPWPFPGDDGEKMRDLLQLRIGEKTEAGGGDKGCIAMIYGTRPDNTDIGPVNGLNSILTFDTWDDFAIFVLETVAVAVLTRIYPSKGDRHENFRLPVAAFLLDKLKLEPDQVRRIAFATASRAGDPDHEDWDNAISSTLDRIKRGLPITSRIDSRVRSVLRGVAVHFGRAVGHPSKSKGMRQVAEDIFANQTARLTDGRVVVTVNDTPYLIDSPEVTSHIWSRLAESNKTEMPDARHVRNVRDFVEAKATDLPKILDYAVQRGVTGGIAWMRGTGSSNYICFDDDGVRIETECPMILAAPAEPWPGLPAPRLADGVVVEGLRILRDRYLAGLVPSEQLKFALAILQGLRPGAHQYMPVVIVGPHGSAKTSRLWIMNMLIAPRIDWVVGSSVPDTRDLFAALRHRPVITFDNVSRLTQAQSDALAPLATGVSKSQRALFTDDREVTASGAWLILMSAISNPGYSPDWRSRTLVIHTDPIPTNQRMSEDRFRRLFIEDYPAILGAFLQLLHLAMKRVKTFDEDSLPYRPRMFDTAVFCETAREELNAAWDLALEPGDIARLLAGEEEESAIDALESAPFVSALVDFLDEARVHQSRFDQIAELYPSLEGVTLDQVREIVTDFHDWQGIYPTWGESVTARRQRDQERRDDHSIPTLEPPGRRYRSERDPTWPKTAEAVSRLLERHAAGLRVAGIEVIRDARRTGKKRRRLLSIRWVEGGKAVA
jgi:hypothetical protein